MDECGQARGLVNPEKKTDDGDQAEEGGDDLGESRDAEHCICSGIRCSIRCTHHIPFAMHPDPLHQQHCQYVLRLRQEFSAAGSTVIRECLRDY